MNFKTIGVWVLLALFLVWTNGINAKTEVRVYKEIDWTELMPKDDLDALLNPPDSVLGIEDGSALDDLNTLNKPELADEKTQRYHAALKSVRVVEAFDKASIKVPGFVVPLVSNEKNLVTEFFIVPYFGACLHMPPPPPNQMLYAKLEKGFELETLYAPFWFEGRLSIETKTHDLGSAAYKLNVDSLYLYEE